MNELNMYLYLLTISRKISFSRIKLCLKKSRIRLFSTVYVRTCTLLIRHITNYSVYIHEFQGFAYENEQSYFL